MGEASVPSNAQPQKPGEDEVQIRSHAEGRSGQQQTVSVRIGLNEVTKAGHDARSKECMCHNQRHMLPITNEN
jgi:hypothetical protein